MKPHKHAELIKAWADGAEIERFSYANRKWEPNLDPTWHDDYQYRIKPEPKPENAYIECANICEKWKKSGLFNETHQYLMDEVIKEILKSVEVLK